MLFFENRNRRNVFMSFLIEQRKKSQLEILFQKTSAELNPVCVKTLPPTGLTAYLATHYQLRHGLRLIYDYTQGPQIDDLGLFKDHAKSGKLHFYMILKSKREFNMLHFLRFISVFWGKSGASKVTISVVSCLKNLLLAY